MQADTQNWRDQASYFDFEGHKIAYWTGGSAGVGAKPLLLVHGFPTCAWDWVPTWEQLGSQHRLIACDLLGFGLSDKPRDGYSIHRHNRARAHRTYPCRGAPVEPLASQSGDGLNNRRAV
ncbi:MAG: alpha/beta fold hydrolase, partial [Pseudomonadota bacterium]